MREITSHRTNACNEKITIHADVPAPGTASRRYILRHPQNRNEPTVIDFQQGAIAEVGVNGVTIESLIAVGIDRLEGFQTGPFRCEENEDALRFLSLAMAALDSRTKQRIARGVEGTLTV